jgi:ATP-dependent protease ClpP protease subunit
MKRTWYTMALDAGSKTNATIDILDEIGLFGIGAKEFRDDLLALGDVEHITLRLNSPGGEVFEATAMYTMLDMHPAEITVQVIGVAASAASYLAMVGDTVQIAENAFMMIHLPSTLAWGNEKEMKRALTMLDKLRQQMARAYAKKSGLDTSTIEDMMSEETWFSADEAVEQGFADEVIGEVRAAASLDSRSLRSIPAEAKHWFSRRNPKEVLMDPKSKKSGAAAETSEEMEARLREEIRAEMEAEAEAAATAEAEAAAAAEAEANANANAGKDVNEAVKNARAEIAQIADACTIAGVPEKAAEYIAAGKTLPQVMADLKKQAADGLTNGRTNAHHNNGFAKKKQGGAAEANAGNDVAGIDVAAVYAKWNGAGRRGSARH